MGNPLCSSVAHGDDAVDPQAGAGEMLRCTFGIEHTADPPAVQPQCLRKEHSVCAPIPQRLIQSWGVRPGKDNVIVHILTDELCHRSQTIVIAGNQG